jgi:hypothetical protein
MVVKKEYINKKRKSVLVRTVPGLSVLQVRMLPTALQWKIYVRVLLQHLELRSVKVKNEIVYYKETVECRHLIFSIWG